MAAPEVTDFYIFHRDMDRMGELFCDCCDRIYLLGDEPLLNSDIAEYLPVARVNFLKTRIELITNGLWLGRMTDRFWEALRENEIQVFVTKYPIEADYRKMKVLCEEKDVLFEFFGSESDNKHMSYYLLNCCGRQKSAEHFYLSNKANKCITLKPGKLYPRVVPPNIYHFNNYSGESLVVDDKDGSDIYLAKIKMKIWNFWQIPYRFADIEECKSIHMIMSGQKIVFP